MKYKLLILFGIIILLLLSITIATKLDNIFKKEFSEEEKLKIKEFKELKDKFKTIEPIEYKEEGNIVISSIDVDGKKLIILSTKDKFNEMIK